MNRSVALLLFAAFSSAAPALAVEADDGRTDLRRLFRFTDEMWTRTFGGASTGPGLEQWSAFFDRSEIVPQIGGVVSGSGVGLGLTHTAWRGSRGSAGWNALFTTKGYKELGAFHVHEMGSAGRFTWRNGLRYRDMVEEDFFGLGLESAREDRAQFRLTEASLSSAFDVRLTDTIALSFGGGLRRWSTGTGSGDALPALDRMFVSRAIPGYGGTFDYGNVGVEIVRDTRDSSKYAHRGSLVRGELRQFLGLDAASPGHRRTSFEVQKNVPLPGYDHWLSGRVAAEWLHHDRGSTLPFFLGGSLGGSHSLRSYSLNRFRGEDLLAGSLEYRFALLPGKLDGVVFWDVGGVYGDLGDGDVGNLGDLGIRGLRHSFGAGVRLLKKDDLVLRLELAHGAEGTRVLLSFSGPF